MPGSRELKVYSLYPHNQQEGEGIALVWGNLEDLKQLDDDPPDQGPLVRMHSKCTYGEVFKSLDCDCGPQLEAAQAMMDTEGRGILFYLEGHEGRGAGSYAKAWGYALKEQKGLDTAAAYEWMGLSADIRQYGHCARFLIEDSITNIRLLSNNLRKIGALSIQGIAVARVPLILTAASNLAYLRTKRDKFGHLLPDDL